MKKGKRRRFWGNYFVLLEVGKSKFFIYIVTCCYWPAPRCHCWPIKSCSCLEVIVTYFVEERRELWETLVRCVVRQLWSSVLELEFSARFFKAAQSAGFDNFQAFVWYNQGKWPLEPSKVKKIRLSSFVSKHAVLLRRVGTTSNIRWLRLKRLLCKLLKRSLFEIFLSLNDLFYILTVSRKLPPPEQDGRTVSNIVWFLEFERFVFSWPIVVHFK